MGGTQLPGEAALLQAVPALAAFVPAAPTKLPLEARMYGMFAGFMLAWLYVLVRGRARAAGMPPPIVLLLLVSFIALLGLDGINAMLFDLRQLGLTVPVAYVPRLDLRLATGLLGGIGMAGILLPAAHYSLWKNATKQPLLDGLGDLAFLLLFSALLFMLVVSGEGLLFYPVSLLGVAGVLAAVGALNLILALSLWRREGAACTLFEALNPLALALVLTLLELAFLSLLRYAAFGFGEIPGV